jgi:hypothetical protein
MAQVEQPLPRPLDDPLRVFRKILPWLFALPFALEVVRVAWTQSNQREKDEGVLWVALAVGAVLQLPFIGLVFYLLPRRVVNAFYLRSFRNDRCSWHVRKAIQAALGPEFRLSGIRDPKRRMPVVLRFLAFAVFLFRYCTPKFMNLEAGQDWQARLWRSLGDARCAFIDLSDLTPFVEEEIRLCYHCLGAQRMLFVGDPPRSVVEWKELVAGVLGLGDADRDALHVVLWEDSPAGRKAFHDAVGEFASRLPKGTAGIKPEYAASLEPSPMPAEDVRAEGWRLQMVLGLILVVVVVGLYSDIPHNSWLEVLWILPLVMSGYVLFLMIGYLVDCGSTRERVVVGAWYAVVAAVMVAPFISVIAQAQKVREAAYRAYTKNNLRQIGLAMNQYHATYRCLPNHAIYHNGKPVLSWRVALLPFLGEDELYRQFKLDEPWDSPHNRALLKKIPEVYAPAEGQGNPPYTTVYQVFVSRPGAAPASGFRGLARAGPVVRRDPRRDLEHDPGGRSAAGGPLDEAGGHTLRRSRLGAVNGPGRAQVLPVFPRRLLRRLGPRP